MCNIIFKLYFLKKKFIFIKLIQILVLNILMLDFNIKIITIIVKSQIIVY